MPSSCQEIMILWKIVRSMQFMKTKLRFCFLRLTTSFLFSLPLSGHSLTYKLRCQKVKIDNQIDFVMMFIKLAEKNDKEMKCSFIEMFTRKIEPMHRNEAGAGEEEVEQVQCI